MQNGHNSIRSFTVFFLVHWNPLEHISLLRSLTMELIVKWWPLEGCSSSFGLHIKGSLILYSFSSSIDPRTFHFASLYFTSLHFSICFELHGGHFSGFTHRVLKWAQHDNGRSLRRPTKTTSPKASYLSEQQVNHYRSYNFLATSVGCVSNWPECQCV